MFVLNDGNERIKNQEKYRMSTSRRNQLAGRKTLPKNTRRKKKRGRKMLRIIMIPLMILLLFLLFLFLLFLLLDFLYFLFRSLESSPSTFLLLHLDYILSFLILQYFFTFFIFTFDTLLTCPPCLILIYSKIYSSCYYVFHIFY